MRLRTFIGTLGLVWACSATAQSERGPTEGPPASGPSLTDAFKSLRSRFGSDPKPAESAPASVPATDSATPPALPTGPLKIKEFEQGKKLPPEWSDAHCKLLVEPFSLTDSAASLGMLKAKMEAKGMLDKVTGQSATPVDKKREISNAARRLNWLPMSVEETLGKNFHAEQTSRLVRENRAGKEEYARARKILADVVTHVNEPSPYHFQIFVVTASGGNAESAPGGYIYVDEDLVMKPSEEPRARFAIAHEVSHVLQRHRTRETQQRLTDGIDSVDGLAAVMATAQSNPDGLLKRGVDLKRLFVRHSELQELQADGCAVRLLDSMSADRAEMIKSVKAFTDSLPPPGPPEKRDKATSETMFTELSDGQFSRHPNSDQRTKNLNEVLADLRKPK
jgi:Zn-dependent protease with chaperone function